jgi:hypothetical protein
VVEQQEPTGNEPLKFLVVDLLTCNTPEFLKRRALDYTLMSWVICARLIVPTCSVDEAVTGWKKYYGVEDSQMTKETATRTFYRIFEQWKKFKAAERESKQAEKQPPASK